MAGSFCLSYTIQSFSSKIKSDVIEVSTLLFTLPLPIRTHLSRRVLPIFIHFDQCCQLQISRSLAENLACNHGQSQDGRSDAIACFAQHNLVLTHLVPCIYRDVTVDDSNFMHSQITAGKKNNCSVSPCYFKFIFSFHIYHNASYGVK